MSYQIFSPQNRAELATALSSDQWVIACLCAGWCGSCREYADNFAAWAQRSPEHHFVWIDIEDQADLVGDLDIDNFPTLLMQRGPTVSFFGTMLPDTRVAERLLQTHLAQTPAELATLAQSSAERRAWQDASLQERLGKLPDDN